MAKKVLLPCALFLFVVLATAAAYADLIPISYPPAPQWFDDTVFGGSHPGNPDFLKAGLLTYTNIGGGNGDSGTLDVVMDNEYRPLPWYKEVYMVIDWWSDPDPNGSASIKDPVLIWWVPPMINTPMIHTNDRIEPNGHHHVEYSYTIPIQPEFELFKFGYSGVDVEDTVHLYFLVETKCVPEPSTFVLLGIGAVGLVVCGWRRRKTG
jgi:hypothetical protein